MRVITFRRDDLLPYQQDIYDNDGNLETQVDYANYQDFDSVSYPSTITIKRPLEDYQIVMTVDKVVENQTLTDDQFQIKIPEGTKIQKARVAPSTRGRIHSVCASIPASAITALQGSSKMESNLRPLTLGEILDRTAQLYRTNFLLFAGIASVYAGVVLVLGLLQIGLAEMLRVLHMTQRLQWLTWTTTAIAALLMFLFYGAVMAAISRAVAWVHLGKPATIRGAYQSILPLLGRYLWLMTITFLVVFSPFALLYGAYFGTMVYYVKGFGTDPAAQQAAMSNPQAAIVFSWLRWRFCCS